MRMDRQQQSTDRLEAAVVKEERSSFSGPLTAIRVICTLFVFFCLFLILPPLVPAAAWEPEAAITTYLKDHYPWAEVEVSDVRLSAILPVEQPSAIAVEKTPPGKSVFRFYFQGNKSITATAMVKTYDRVIMSRSGFRKGYVLKQEDIYTTPMETVRIPKGAVREEDRAVGKPLLRSIVPDRPITDTMVAEKPVVRRGHRVILAVESAGFSIKTVGEIDRDSVIGEYVKVLNLSSKKCLKGLLVDENAVRVEF